MNKFKFANELKKTNPWNAIDFDMKEKNDTIAITITVTGSSKKMRKTRANEIKRLAFGR